MLSISATYTPRLQLDHCKGPYSQVSCSDYSFFGLPYTKMSDKGQHSVKKLL